ncbi:MAG: GAF domain-containing protein, partial [Candidatus Rokubacteria bacterium]|nr:GAF domain-containing protein [Candidatus Rokubacteria bacterium]
DRLLGDLRRQHRARGQRARQRRRQRLPPRRRAVRLQPLHEGLDQHLRRALTGEPSTSSEVHAAGQWLEARAAPLRDAAGAVTGAVVFVASVGERRWQSRLVQAIEAIGRSLVSSLDLDRVLDTIVASAVDLLGADAATVIAWDGEAPEYRVLRSAGRLSAQYSTAGAITAGRGPVGRAVTERRTITTRNILADPSLVIPEHRRRQIAEEGFKAVAAAPLAGLGRVHGALVVNYWVERDFTVEETSALALLAEHATLAIENARTYADARRRAERLHELATLERAVTASLELDDVLRRIADATARLVGAPLVIVWAAEPEARVFRRRAWSAESTFAFQSPPTIAFGAGLVGSVAESCEATFVADVTSDPRVLGSAVLAGHGLLSLIAVPVVAGAAVLGVITVHARRLPETIDEDVALVSSLAGQAAVAMQNARVYAQAVRRAARLGHLVAVSQSITISLDPDDVTAKIVAAGAELREGALCAIRAYDPEREVLRFAAHAGEGWDELPSERPAEAGLPGLVVQGRIPVLVRQPGRHPRALSPAWWKQRPDASYYGVPITVGETFLGVLDYIAPDGVPDREEQEAVQLLAAQAGVAIVNASLFQAERVQSERTRVLATINQRLSSALDLDQLLLSISRSAAHLTGVAFVAFWLADDVARRVTFMDGSVPEMARDLSVRSAGYDDGIVGRVARDRTPIVVDDVAKDDRMLVPDWWPRWKLTSFAGYPVVAGDQVLAVLSLCHSEPVRFSHDTQDVVDMFIAQASVAIQNARLYREAQRRRAFAEGLARLGRELTETLEPERVARVLTRGISELLDVRGAGVYRYRPEDGLLEGVAAWSSLGETAQPITLKPGEGVSGIAVAERRIVVTPDIFDDPNVALSSATRELLLRGNFHAAVAVPLIAHGRVVGALALAAEKGRRFDADELAALQAFADQAAIAFENARLYATARESYARLRETQAQLVQAAKLSALGQLVSGVAHELNNPLSVIIGYGQLLMTRDVPPALRRPLELIVAQGERMAKIVHNLLYFARQRPPEHNSVDLNHVMDQTLALRQNQLLLAGITVERDFDAALPPIIGDPQQLQQVFLNLLLNAEQAITGAGVGGHITLRTRAAGDLVQAQVIDDGPGIAAEHLSRVFEPFFTTKEPGGGTGLGLSVSYGIVQEH